MKEILDTIIIGGGQVGLASGYDLKKKGLHFFILDASNQIERSWPSYYDSYPKITKTAQMIASTKRSSQNCK